MSSILKLNYTSASPIISDSPVFSGSSPWLNSAKRVLTPEQKQTAQKTSEIGQQNLSVQPSPIPDEDGDVLIGASDPKEPDYTDFQVGMTPYRDRRVVPCGINGSDHEETSDGSFDGYVEYRVESCGINGSDHEYLSDSSFDGYVEYRVDPCGINGSDHEESSVGTEEVSSEVVVSTPQAQQDSLSLWQVTNLLNHYKGTSMTSIDIIMELLSKTKPQNVLIAAAITNSFSLIPKIIQFRGLDVDERDWRGNTALHLAIVNRSVEAVATLLDRGANLSLTNNMGVTAYEMLNQENLLDAVRQFTRNCPDR